MKQPSSRIKHWYRFPYRARIDTPHYRRETFRPGTAARDDILHVQNSSLDSACSKKDDAKSQLRS
jgi:hypothetical protein